MDSTQKKIPEINPTKINKEVANFIIKQLKSDRADTRHKVTYITEKAVSDKPFK